MNEFENLVFEMREAQKGYYKTKNRDWLVKAKKLEQQVDSHLDIINSPKLF